MFRSVLWRSTFSVKDSNDFFFLFYHHLDLIWTTWKLFCPQKPPPVLLISKLQGAMLMWWLWFCLSLLSNDFCICLFSLKDPPTSTALVQMTWPSSLWLKLTPCTTRSCPTPSGPPAARMTTTPASRMASLTAERGTACLEVINQTFCVKYFCFTCIYTQQISGWFRWSLKIYSDWTCLDRLKLTRSCFTLF